MAENRIKEIGVRKVLRRSVTGITALLSKDFLILVIVSFVIAAPVAWWAMSTWLKDYPYRVNIQWWVFAMAGFICLYCIVHGKLPGNKSSRCKSCEEFENGIM